MTVGALIQLNNGLSDRMAYLTLNPSFSHFKTVYARYTLFAMDTIVLLPSKNAVLSYDNDTQISFKIGRNGDLVRQMCVTFEMPDIYSPSSQLESTAVNCGGYHSFCWIQRLGEYMIKSATVSIGTQLALDRHTSEWLHINSELNLADDKKLGYYEMIGHIPEYYDPASGAGCGGAYPSGYTIAPTVGAPSIVGRRVVVPLQFWFNNPSAPSSSFPLVATQLMEIWIHITMRKLRELFTLIDGATGFAAKPPPGFPIGHLRYPVQPNTTTLDLNVNMEVNYIFLDRVEQKIFSEQSHEYLITQVQCKEHIASDSANIRIDISAFAKPVIYMAFAIRRSDMEDANQWSNFTNWTNAIPPYRAQFLNPYGDNPNGGDFPAKIAYYKTQYMLRGARLLLNGTDVYNGRIYNFDNGGSELNGKDSAYFNYIQSYCFTNKVLLSRHGIYIMAFSLNTQSQQPAGAINMSSINNKELVLSLIDRDPDGGYDGQQYNYNIHVFAVNYELVRILGGHVGTATAN
jgi:hypothetical protein